MSGSFRDFLKYLKESGKSKELKGGDFMRKASALWRGVEYHKAKRCSSDSDCPTTQRCGVRGGCVRRRSVKSLRRSPVKSPRRSPLKSPRRSPVKSPRRSPRRSPVKTYKWSPGKEKKMEQSRLKLVDRLRKDQTLFNIMDGDGFLDMSMIDTYGLEVDELGDEIEVDIRDDGKTYIRAMYGWKGAIAYRVLSRQYQPYRGIHRVFCISHTSMVGLGELNFGRRVNVLDTPERCKNKGVKACINIERAGKNGLAFFSKIGDKYGNRIFCFDPELKENFISFEYSPEYEANLEELPYFKNYIRFMPKEKAVKMMKRLFMESP